LDDLSSLSRAGSVRALKAALDEEGVASKLRTAPDGVKSLSRAATDRRTTENRL
jgi:hypothetical protein